MDLDFSGSFFVSILVMYVCVSSNFQANPIDPTTASKILPGARNYQDIEKYLNQAKKEKLDLLKKKNKW